MHQTFSPPPFPLFYRKTHFSKTLIRFCANPSLSSNPIFLPLLHDQDLTSPLQRQQGEEQDEVPHDSMLRFFKSRTSTRDPKFESKLSLQSNRRPSWRLASASDPESDSEFDVDEDKEQVGSDPITSAQGISGEILHLAQNLPENSTLEEVLGPYVGRVGERESLEVLEKLSEEGFVMGCLYFFEWMRLQEPSLVTARTCSLLFPTLGRAGMADELMILFRNLPKTRQFRDVRVYNAAISGLLSCGRYKISRTLCTV